MNANRRGFLGLFGGAVASGPSLAKSVLTDTGRYKNVAKKTLYPSVPTGESPSEYVNPENVVSFWENRLKKMFQPDEYEEQYKKIDRSMSRRSVEIETLKSLSKSHKYTMMENNIRRRGLLMEENQIWKRIRNITQGRGPYDDGE